MESIKIIRDKMELEGTCYIELSLGKYQGKHWCPTSLFFEEEIFGLIEPIFEIAISDYDHYGMNNADKDEWNKALIELKKLASLLESANEFSDVMNELSFIFSGTRDYFQNHFEYCKIYLFNMITELIEWAEKNIKKHGYIAMLGI